MKTITILVALMLLTTGTVAATDGKYWWWDAVAELWDYIHDHEEQWGTDTATNAVVSSGSGTNLWSLGDNLFEDGDYFYNNDNIYVKLDKQYVTYKAMEDRLKIMAFALAEIQCRDIQILPHKNSCELQLRANYLGECQEPLAGMEGEYCPE